jgi:hypothetical protein
MSSLQFLTYTSEDLQHLTDLNLATMEAIKGYPLQALHKALQILGIRNWVVGERKSVLSFKAEPLSYSLRITGEHYLADDEDDLPGLTNPCRTVHLHTPFSARFSIACHIQDRKSLVNALEHIQGILREANSPRGRLRAQPVAEQRLLGILRSKCRHYCPQFAECERAVERDCLLDACVELLTPFGLQPRENERRKVVFNYPTMMIPEITKLDGYVGVEEDQVLEPFISAVVVTGLATNDLDLMDEDSQRRVTNIASCAGITDLVQKDLVPRAGLVFILSSQEERYDLVCRLLAYRREKVMMSSAEKRVDMKQWLGKQESGRALTHEEYMEKYRNKKMGKAQGKKSPLSCFVENSLEKGGC